MLVPPALSTQRPTYAFHVHVSRTLFYLSTPVQVIHLFSNQCARSPLLPLAPNTTSLVLPPSRFLFFCVSVFKSSSLKKGAMVGETKDEEVLRLFNHGSDRAHHKGVFRSPFTERKNWRYLIQDVGNFCSKWYTKNTWKSLGTLVLSVISKLADQLSSKISLARREIELPAHCRNLSR